MPDVSAADAPLAPLGPPDPPEARDDRGRVYRVFGNRVLRTDAHGRRPHTFPLDDPGRPAFLELPRIDLDDGRPLRRTAFSQWADVLRRDLDAGLVLETRYRRPEILPAFMTLVGGGIVAGISAAVLVGFAATAGPRSGIQPTAVDMLFAAVAVAMLVYMITRSLVAMRRAWLCRAGSFVHVDRRGIRTRKGQVIRGFEVVRSARYHQWLQCTRLELEGDDAPLWVPQEHGPFGRLDLVLAGLNPTLAAAHREL